MTLEITPKGKRTLKTIEKEKDHWLEVMLADLSRSERLDLLEKIRRIIRRCRKLEYLNFMPFSRQALMCITVKSVKRIWMTISK